MQLKISGKIEIELDLDSHCFRKNLPKFIRSNKTIW